MGARARAPTCRSACPPRRAADPVPSRAKRGGEVPSSEGDLHVVEADAPELGVARTEREPDRTDVAEIDRTAIGIERREGDPDRVELVRPTLARAVVGSWVGLREHTERRDVDRRLGAGAV